ncbi:MAG: hypothetical protein ACTFAK_11435 [Candidatus Electronema sp. VV]
MPNKSILKLLQEANEVKKALEKIAAGLPEGLTAADMAAKIAGLETVVGEVDAANADLTRLVNRKGEQAEAVSHHQHNDGGINPLIFIFFRYIVQSL